MNTKLTLTIEEQVIQEAKVLAKSRGQSLSSMVENYFKALTQKEHKGNPVPESKIMQLRGIIKSKGPLDYKKIIEDERIKKYGH
ncbi:MAG: DUF6364 family protein [Cyclobacteriaceae bacterium]